MEAEASFGGMPRYFRHIRHGGQLIEDPEGTELPDLEAARAEVLDGVRDLLGEAIRQGRDDWLDDAIVVTDLTGQELMTIPFIEALPLRLYKAVLDMLSSNTRSSSTPDLEEARYVPSPDRQT